MDEDDAREFVRTASEAEVERIYDRLVRYAREAREATDGRSTRGGVVQSLGPYLMETGAATELSQTLPPLKSELE
jgi:hypothetical protein